MALQLAFINHKDNRQQLKSRLSPLKRMVQATLANNPRFSRQDKAINPFNPFKK